jgi:hypothetical protein
MSDDKRKNGNGSGSRVWKILETLLIAFVIGGITMWGSSQRMEERLKGMESTLSKLDACMVTAAAALTDHLIKSAAADAGRDAQIQTNTQLLKELRADQVRRKKLE